MANEAIKIYAIQKNVPFWQIAESIGIHESTFSRKLRHDLPPEDQSKIRSIIDDLAENKRN